MAKIKEKVEYRRKLQRTNASENIVQPPGGVKKKQHKTFKSLMKALQECLKLKPKEIPKKRPAAYVIAHM